MIKICSHSLILLLKIIFEHFLKKGKFPEIWKKANLVPIHKKDKMLVKYYCPISLLPIFRKMFERVIYNFLFNYFQSNRLFTPFQSGFPPGDLCITQLLSIIHEIRTAFDENLTVDVRGVFLGISKLFDKVCMMESFLTTFATQKLSGKLRANSCHKWSNIRVETNNVWNSTRISTRNTLVFNIHK